MRASPLAIRVGSLSQREESDPANVLSEPSRDALRMCNPTSTGVCEACAERGRPNEPVYKMGMCEFCFKGLRHPKATRAQLAKERGREAPDSASSPRGQRRVQGLHLSVNA